MTDIKLLKFEDLRNYSDNEFLDISSEIYRVYTFNGLTIEINFPLALSVSENGGHRIFDARNISHYIPAGWLHLEWEAKPDCPNFVV